MVDCLFVIIISIEVITSPEAAKRYMSSESPEGRTHQIPSERHRDPEGIVLRSPVAEETKENAEPTLMTQKQRTTSKQRLPAASKVFTVTGCPRTAVRDRDGRLSLQVSRTGSAVKVVAGMLLWG